jgi:ABC-type dipeptide/oligopeptide/nickel transport system ATPase subunit
MLWGDETVSALDVPVQHQVSNIPRTIKTMFQAHETVLLRIGTITPGNQGIATAIATLRKQLAERQGNTISHRIGRKHR